MADRVYKGEWRISYVSPVGPPVTHVLAAPLGIVREFVPSSRGKRFHWWSDDNKHDEIVNVGGDVYEVVVTLRLDNDPVGLSAMLRVALKYGVTLTIQTSESGPEYPVRLVEIIGAESPDVIGIQPDRDLWSDGTWEVPLRLRRIDGGTLNGLL